MSQVQQQNQNQSTFKSTVSSIGKSIYSLKTNIKNSQGYRSLTETQEQLNQEYVVPLKNFYDQLPSQIAQVKLDVLREYSFNQRFTTVNILALFTAVITYKRFHNVQLLTKSLVAVRNTGISYFIGGLFIAPEIYNPLMKDQ